MKEEVRFKISYIYKILILIVCGIGLYLNFKIKPFSEMILYFTIQSNLMCFIFYFVAIVLKMTKKLKKNNAYYLCKGMVTMAITITMVVYWGLLASGSGLSAYEGYETACRFVHLYTPLMIIIDYIVFGEKGNLKKSFPFIWSLVLIAYAIFDIIYVAFGGTFTGGTKYPYFYMDIDKYGLFRVVINCLIVYMLYVIYGMLVQVIDNIIGKRKK